MSQQTLGVAATAKHYYDQGDPLGAGKIIFEALPMNDRVLWATTILKAVIQRTGFNSLSINQIIRIAEHPSSWGQAHAAFDAARDTFLALPDALSKRSRDQMLLLSQLALAELVAKVVYNATNPPDEFDEDSGWWIVPCVKEILDLLQDDEFAHLVEAKVFPPDWNRGQ